MSITEQEKVSLLREGFVRARINPEFVLTPRDRETLARAEADARRVYPDPVTYGPVITTPGDAGQELRRRSDGQWETRKYGDWTVSPYITDAYLLSVASCVPVTDAEAQAAVAYLLGRRVDQVSIRAALTAARAAMRQEGTR